MKKVVFGAAAILFAFGVASAQLRPVEKTPTAVAANAPDVYHARYEGGIFGQASKDKGTLKFEDENHRVVFYRQDGKEMFGIAYDALLVIYPDSKTSESQSGKVIGALPLPGAGLAHLMTKDSKYLIINYEDPDIDVKGVANFKFDDKDSLLMFINKLGAKANMKQRGDAFYRPKKNF